MLSNRVSTPSKSWIHALVEHIIHHRPLNQPPYSQQETGTLIAYLQILVDDPDNVTHYHLEQLIGFLTEQEILDLSLVALQEAGLKKSSGRTKARLNRLFKRLAG